MKNHATLTFSLPDEGYVSLNYRSGYLILLLQEVTNDLRSSYTFFLKKHRYYNSKPPHIRKTLQQEGVITQIIICSEDTTTEYCQHHLTTHIHCLCSLQCAKARRVRLSILLSIRLPAHYLNAFIEPVSSHLVSFQRLQSFSFVFWEGMECSADNILGVKRQ
jgi:hypothetical protein